MIARTLAMLALVPAAPRVVTVRAIAEELAARGMPVTRRTVQRDLLELSAVLPLVANETSKPFGWSWAPGAACPCCGSGWSRPS